MTGTIAKYALRHRAIVLALTLLFVVAGVNAFEHLPVEAYPDVTNVSFQIISLFPGHAAEEVERLVTIPIENQMNGIPDRTSIRSVSIFGLSQVTITFEDGADVNFVRNQAAQLLAAVTLPDGVQAGLSPNATPIGEIYRYTLKAPKGFPLVELKALEDWVVERQFRTVPGVVDVVGFGGPTKQYQVLIDPAKLRSYGIPLKQVFDALASGNQNAGGSYIEHGPELYIVRGLGFIRDIDDIRNIAVDTRAGTPIRISDLGDVRIGEQLRLGRVGKIIRDEPDQDDVVMGIVIMRRGENALEVLKRVREKVGDINRNYLPAGIRIVPHYDRTDLTQRTLHTARKNMTEGISLVGVVLVLFLGLGNYRSALIVAAVVPLSLLGAFLLLDLRGIPANLISLGAIDFGIIVDSAVIVVEDVLHKLEQDRARIGQLPETIVASVQEMGRPILFSKAILLTAFIPLYTLQRVEGKIFRPMALTLTFALVTGTILALTLIPVLAAFSFKGRFTTEESWLVRRLVPFYRGLLERAMRSRALVLGGALGALALAGVVLASIGSEFLPKLDEGSLWVRGFIPQTIAPSDADALSRHVRAILVSFPEVKTVVTQLGRPDDGTDVNGWDIIECAIELRDRSEWTTASTREELVEAMNAKLSEIPGMPFQFSQYIEDNVNEAVSGIKAELSIKIYGSDPGKLQELADRSVEILKGIPGAADVGTDRLIGQPQVQITIDRTAIARYGLTVADVQQIIATALGGGVAHPGARGRAHLRPGGEGLAHGDLRPGRDPQDPHLRLERRTAHAGRGHHRRRAPRLRAHLPRGERAPHGGEVLGARPRPRLADRRGQGRDREGRGASRRLPHGVDRRVREPAARGEAAGGGRADHADRDLLPAVHRLRLGAARVPDPAGRPVRGGGRRARATARRAEPVRVRPGRIHGPVRHRDAERRDPGRAHPRAAQGRQRARRRGARRRAVARAARGDDRDDGRARAAADGAVARGRRGDLAPVRGGDHRGAVHRHRGDAAGAPAPVPVVRGEERAQLSR